MKVSTLLLFVLLAWNASTQTWKPVEGKIMTKWAKEVSPRNVWQEYPRPQFERSEWLNLNGLWNYSILKKNQVMPEKFQGKILVPFCVESALSGVGKEVTEDDRIWYKRQFELPASWKGKGVILNFEAVDYASSVWVNGIMLGSHKGGFDRFSFDITPFINLNGKQEIVVCVDDATNLGTQVRGKQRLSEGRIWYTPVSGIWQTVWLEAVSNEAFLKEIKITPDIDAGKVSLIPLSNKPLLPGYKVKLSVLSKGKEVAASEVKVDKETDLKIDNATLWSPDNPFLYDLKLTLLNPKGEVIDQVNSYFGMRKISLGNLKGNQFLFLNNKPLFQYGTLDQGWWPDGLHTAPTDEALIYDIEVTKKMGFNMIRKHIKVEPDRWYYHCDKLGILVWQDMPSAMAEALDNETGKIRNLQFVGGKAKDLHQRTEDAAQFELELRRMVDIHYNSPSIVMWVPFNEGWGQFATCRIANMVKEIDPTRLVNAISGWALRPCGDIYDIHTYQTEVNIPAISLDRASVIGEFGGIGYPLTGHLWNPDMKNWGYQTYHTSEELWTNYLHKFNQIVEMKKTKGLSAAVYTQTTDVEGEVNGLITYDREIIKISAEELNKTHSVLYKQ